MNLTNIKKILNIPPKHGTNNTKCYLGSTISSFMFDGQLNKTVFSKIETKLKKKCKLDDIPYQLFNEYCYNNFIYYTNGKNDKLHTLEPINTIYLSKNKTNIDVKITHYNQHDHDTHQFNCQHKYHNTQPFLIGSLKINENIFIKLRKNLFKYDLKSDISSYQIFIEIKWENIKPEYFNIVSKVLYDVVN
jgi:hypothetical protein